MNILKKVVVALLYTTVLFANSSNDNMKWHNLLSEKKYEKIDSLLQNIKKDILKNPNNESKLSKAIDNLLLDKSLRENLQEYAKVKPNSPFSHLLLGYDYFYKAFDARGYKFVGKTPKSNFVKMREILVKADDEFLKSLKLDSKIPSTYGALIASYALDSKDEKRDDIYKKGIKKLPNSYIIRKVYMRYSLLKWGGSIEKIESLLKDARAHYKSNPLLKKLEGYTDYAKADFYAIQKKDYEKGLIYINKALEKSDNLNYYYLRGVIYKYLKRYNKALDDFNIILKDSPSGLNTLKQRESVYLSLKNYDLALKDAETILKYDKKDSYAYYVRGVYYYDKGEFDLAKIDFLDSIKLSESAGAKKYLAYCYYAKKEYSEAADYLQQALDAGSKDSSVYYYLSVSLWYKHDCKFVKNAYKYKESCTLNGDCNQEWVDWAIKSADYAKARGICKE